MPVPAATVVLVEDSVPYAMLVGALLADLLPGGVEVRRFESLRSGLESAVAQEPDCILLDLSLPDAEGLEGLAALLEAGVEAPIVVLSGRDDEQVALQAIRAGAQDYVVKGDERDRGVFRRTIRHAIERRRVQVRSEDLLRAKEDRWRTLTHLAPVGIVETDRDGRCVFANERFAELTGRPRDAAFGLGWRDAVDPDDLPSLDADVRAAAAGDGEFAREVRFVCPDGRVVWTHVTAVLLRDPWGGAAGWLGTIVDVTAAHEAREELRVAEQELRRQQQDVLAIAALARDAGAADDPAPALLAGARPVLGADFATLLVHDGAGRLVVAATDGLRPALSDAVAVDDPRSAAAACFAAGERVEIADARDDAHVAPALVRVAGARTVVFEPVPSGADVLGVLTVGWREPVAPLGARRSTLIELVAAELGAALERRRLLNQLRDLARTDPLTGLANRRVWDERLADEIPRARRHGRALCIAMLDLDLFKAYNDRHGHQAGDDLLRSTTADWQEVLRGTDLLSRLGGDEFALMLPDCDVDRGRGIVERLQGATHAEIGCSAGLVAWAEGEEPGELVRRADAALYAAKAEGRGGIRLG